MTTWERKQGDVNDTLLVGLCGIEDITGVTPLGLVRLSGGALVQLSGGSVVNAIATTTEKCSVEIPLGGVGGWLADASPGEWKYETQLTFMDGSILTWPGKGYDMIVVTEDLGP